jgi:hypothetical protein
VGIYIQCAGTIGNASRVTANAIIDSARAWALANGLESIFFGSVVEDGAWVSIYPPTGGFRFRVHDGRVSFSEKTSIAGPGYHEALIDLCDYLGTDLGLSWSWSVGGDETGYALSRSRSELEQAFVEQFRAFCDFYSRSPANLRFNLNLAEGIAIDGYEGVATPLGPMPLEFFLRLADSRDATAIDAETIFPWWSRTLEDDFWRRTLVALLWTEVEWRAPRTPWERRVHAWVFALSQRLRDRAGADISSAIEDLKSVSGDAERFLPPGKSGIGYLRNSRTFFLPGPWRVNLPGYYIEETEDDGGTTCLWFGSEEVRASSFNYDLAEPGAFRWSEALAREQEVQGLSCRYRLPSTARPSSVVDGSYSITGEFQAMDESGVGQMLILSVFGPEREIAGRLEEIATAVWFDPPKRAPGMGN